MIYGKLSLKDWRTARVEGETPESSFESYNFRLFFFGTLYNRDQLQSSPADSNAKLVADAYLADSNYGFSRLDGSFTIVYYSKEECGIVRDHHGTHYSIYCTPEGDFASSWTYLEKQSGKPFSYDPGALGIFLRRGLLPQGFGSMADASLLGGGEQFHMFTENGFITFITSELPEEVRSLSWNMLKEKSPEFKEMLEEGSFSLKRDHIFRRDPQIVTDITPDVESYSRRYGELHRQAIRRRIGDSHRVGVLLSGGYDSGANLAALRSIYDGPVDSYSVGFKGDAWTELPMARLMSETFGTCHHEYEIDGTEIASLPDIVRFLGEPFVEGGLMVNYCAMRMIGEDKPDVILGGDGSDQYFGTSGREVALHYLAARTGTRPLMRGVHKLLSCKTFDTGGKLSRINFHLGRILHILEGEQFGFSDSSLREIMLHPEWIASSMKTFPADTRSFEHLYTQHALLSDLETSINYVILYKASRMAQMFGNNLAFPFMDLDLYNFLQELPVGLKCKGDSVPDIARGRFESKYLLKYHYKSLLPAAITSKRKQGGFAPMPLFFQDPLQRARIKDFILSADIYEDFLNRDGVERFLNEYDREASRKGGWFWYKQNKALQYFNLLTLVTWWEEFIERKEVKYW